MTAKAEVRKLCERRYGKGKYEMRDNPKAMDSPGKVERRELRNAARAEKNAAEDALRKLPRADAMLADLAEASQFVVDVSGDNPSIPKLAETLMRVHEWQRADERNKDAADILRKLDVGGYSHRCEVSRYELGGPIPFSVQVAAGDTWDAVLEQLKQASKADVMVTTTA